MASGAMIELKHAAFRATVSGDGRPGPIEERVGRRLLRIVNPLSEEGTRLLRSGQVEIVGPWGESFGRIDVREAWNRLVARLEKCLGDDRAADDALRAELNRLRELVGPDTTN